jgi:hypothetical protein
MFEEYQPKKRQKINNMTERQFQHVSLVNPDFNYDEWIQCPEPSDVTEFLETPYKFCPKEDFINNTFVDVSLFFEFHCDFLCENLFLLFFRKKVC